MVPLSEISRYLDSWAPFELTEEYDNVGLLVGNPNCHVNRILVSLDVTEAVVDEAIENQCQLIISHHPIIFQGLKRLTGQNFVARIVEKAIRANISLYAIHTNLDNVSTGVNKKMAEVLGLKNPRILKPTQGKLIKISWFTPKDHYQKVLEQVHLAGAGQIGNYSDCGFSSEGTGQFKPNESANPRLGKIGSLEVVNEIKSEVVLPLFLKNKVLQALFDSHPYEEVGYFITNLENEWGDVGSGMVGDLEEDQNWDQFIQDLKSLFRIPVIRHTSPVRQVIKKVAICGGSGFFLLPNAIEAEADVFITSDIKYHQFFDADGRLALIDVGHFESEQFTSQLIVEKLSVHFANIAVLLSQVRTNPVFYA
jgi:dinuclear metal center YbgI/SA1388 family protein